MGLNESGSKPKQRKVRTTTITIRLTPEQKRKVEEYAFSERIDIADMMTPAFIAMWGEVLGIPEPQ